MLIPINSGTDAGTCAEWAVIELQGEIQRKPDEGGIKELEIGTLCLSKTKKDQVQLTIGYHQLEGKLLPLKKPVAILEKQVDRDSQHVQYKVIGILRSKYMFKMRPKALISKPDVKRTK